MIIKNVTVAVSNNSTVSNPTLVFYKGDYCLLNITLKDFNFDITKIERVDVTFTNKDNSQNISLGQIEFNNKTIVVSIVDTLFYALGSGSFDVQLHLFDEGRNRISVPAFELIAKDPIFKHPIYE